MKARELIGYLSMMDPDSDLDFCFGETDLYRRACAKLIAEEPVDIDYRDSVTPMLEHLDISKIEFSLNTKDINITFEQGYISDEGIRKEITDLRNEINKKA